MSAAAPGSHATLAALFDKVDGSEGELEDFVTEVLPLVGPRAFASAFDLEARGARVERANARRVFEELAPLRTLAQVADALLYSSVGEVTQRVAFCGACTSPCSADGASSMATSAARSFFGPAQRQGVGAVWKGTTTSTHQRCAHVFARRPRRSLSARSRLPAALMRRRACTASVDVSVVATTPVALASSQMLMHICISKDPTHNVIEFKHLTGGARADACAKTAHAARE